MKRHGGRHSWDDWQLELDRKAGWKLRMEKAAEVLEVPGGPRKDLPTPQRDVTHIH